MSLAELQATCREMGIPGSLIRKHMNSVDELESLIESFEKGKAHVKEVKRKMARPVARAKAKGRPRPKAITLKSSEETKPTRRPAVRKPAGRKAAPIRKATTTTRKRTATRQTASKKRTTTKQNSEVGRNVLGKINFSKTDGWNPREGSIVDDIFQALKQCKGDREKTFALLLEWEALNFWVPRTKPNGEKRDKKEQEAMLKYRISRTLWDFAIATGQHDTNPNFGTGEHAKNGKTKPATRRGRKPATPARRGRPKQTTAKATPRRKAKASTAVARRSRRR